MRAGCPNGAGDALLDDALYPPLPVSTGESDMAGVPILGDAIRPLGDGAGEPFLGVALYPPLPIGTGCPMGAGELLLAVALYPPLPIGTGCTNAAGDLLLGDALYPPLPIGEGAAAAKRSLGWLGGMDRDRALRSSSLGDRLRGEPL